MLNHVRINVGTRVSKFQQGSSQVGVGFTVKYFNANRNASYSDLRFDASTTKKVFAGFSVFNRFWYPEDGASILSEANFKFGVVIKGLKLGPSVSVRANILSNNFSFKTDGNNYRIGGFLEGTQKLGKHLTWFINLAASYNGNYSQNFSVDSEGLIQPGTIDVRHPITIRLSTSLIYDIKGMFDVFVNGEYFNINNDFPGSLLFTVVDRSTRTTFKMGLTYKYNRR